MREIRGVGTFIIQAEFLPYSRITKPTVILLILRLRPIYTELRSPSTSISTSASTSRDNDDSDQHDGDGNQPTMRAAGCWHRHARGLGGLGANLSNQTIPNMSERFLERIEIVRLPVSAIGTRLGLFTLEGDEKDIVVLMAVVAGQVVLRETGPGERDGHFAGVCVAIGVSPNAVELFGC